MIALMQALAAPTAGISLFLADSPLGVSRAYEEVSGVAGSLFGLLGIAIAVGLWRLKRWAWVATMLWFGFSMAGALLAYRAGEPQYAIMVIGIVTVFYLNQRDVQHAFRARTAAADSADDTPATRQSLTRSAPPVSRTSA